MAEGDDRRKGQPKGVRRVVRKGEDRRYEGVSEEPRSRGRWGRWRWKSPKECQGLTLGELL